MPSIAIITSIFILVAVGIALISRGRSVEFQRGGSVHSLLSLGESEGIFVDGASVLASKHLPIIFSGANRVTRGTVSVRLP